MNLTTKTSYKAHAGIKQSDTSKDAALDVFIPALSSLVAKRLKRDFETATYRVWLDGNGKSYMKLPQWPVTRIYEVSLHAQDVAEVTFTGGSRANINCDGTSINLFSISTAGVETDTAVVLATYPTITELVAQITAQTGWTATADSEMGDDYSVVIKPFDSQWCQSPDTVDLQIPDESTGVRLVSQTNRMIELTSGSCFPHGRSNVWCWYTAGYTLPTDGELGSGNVPEGLQMLMFQTIKDAVDIAKRDGTLKSEKIGGYQYTVSEAIAGGSITLVGLIERRIEEWLLYGAREV